MMTGNESRDEIETLLPWFAAGTLGRKDAERVQRALEDDAALSRSYALVREELAETIHLNETLGAPSARAMEKLFEKIEAESPVTRQAAPSASFVARLSDFVMGLSPRTLAWSGAAAMLAIVLQAGIITAILVNESSGNGGYRTVGIEQAAPKAEGTFALVRFSPQATAGDIATFLEARKASIVSGPTTGGLYRVRIASATISPDEAARLVKSWQDDKLIGFAASAP